MKKIMKKNGILTAIEVPEIVFLNKYGSDVETEADDYIISVKLLGEFMALPEEADLGLGKKADVDCLLVHKEEDAIAWLTRESFVDSFHVNMQSFVADTISIGFWEALYSSIPERVEAIIEAEYFSGESWYFTGRKTHTLYEVHERGISSLMLDGEKQETTARRDGLALDDLCYEEYGIFPLSSIEGTEYEGRGLKTATDLLKCAVKNSRVMQYLEEFGLCREDIQETIRNLAS